MSGLAEILARIPVEANQWFFQLGSVAIELLGAGTTEMDEHFCVTRRPLVADLLRHSSQAQSGANCWGHARLPSMVTAAFYFATLEDQTTLLDYLGEPDMVTLHPWPVVRNSLVALGRADALATAQVMVVNRDLGPPVLIRPGDGALDQPTKAGVFNRLNWERLHPGLGEGLVDSNASPVLLWVPGEIGSEVIGVSQIGSQADAMAAISADYGHWVNRTTGWIRRKGTKVWGLEQGTVRPDLNIQLGFINSVYALPGALRALEQGAVGH